MNTHADRHVATSQLDALAAHGEHEAAALAAYRRLIENSADEGVKYLGRLILEDEERHHHLIAEMSNRIASWVAVGRVRRKLFIDSFASLSWAATHPRIAPLSAVTTARGFAPMPVSAFASLNICGSCSTST